MCLLLFTSAFTGAVRHLFSFLTLYHTFPNDISPVFYFLLQNGDKRQQILPASASYIHPLTGKAMTAIPNRAYRSTTGKEIFNMSSKNSNKLNIPEAKAAMDKFKMEAANEVGVNLKNGYNGDLTSREAGSVGGQMVKKMSTIRTASFKRADRTALGHEVEVRYIAGITI